MRSSRRKRAVTVLLAGGLGQPLSGCKITRLPAGWPLVTHAVEALADILLARASWGLDAIPVTYAEPWLDGPDGWHFEAPRPAGDPVPDATRMWEVYAAAEPHHTGRVTVPVPVPVL